MNKTNWKETDKISNPDAGSTLYEIAGLTAAIHDEQISIALTRVESDGSVPRHKHLKSEEFYIFTRGKGTMRINEKDVEVTAGDTVKIEIDEIHELHVEPGGFIEFYAVTIPPYRQDDFILVSGEEE